MNKRERLEHTFAGEATDRPPVNLWRYWQGDDVRSADLARSLVQFQEQFDWDFMVIAANPNFSTTGYGVHDQWTGSISGQREIIRHPINRSLNWTELRPIDPTRGDIAKQLGCVRLLDNHYSSDDLPRIQVIYSPLTQAAQLAPQPTLLQHLRRQPDRFRTGMNVLTETTLLLIEELQRKTNVAGILYITNQANYDLLSEDEYNIFGLPYDKKILETLPNSWWFNMIQVQGNAPMVHLFSDFEVHALSWADQRTRPSLDRAITSLDFKGAFAGGLDNESHLIYGTPATIRDATRSAIVTTSRRRLIVSCGEPVQIIAPQSNYHAVRHAVE